MNGLILIQKILILVHYWPIFPNFVGTIFFPDEPGKTSYGFLAPCQHLQNTNDPIPRKRLARRKDGRAHRSYFIKPFGLNKYLNKYLLASLLLKSIGLA